MKAFPSEYWVETHTEKGTTTILNKENGMDLRDYFAAKAMQANLSNPEFLQVVTAEQANGKDCADRVAKISYLYADAMMKAREK